MSRGQVGRLGSQAGGLSSGSGGQQGGPGTGTLRRRPPWPRLTESQVHHVGGSAGSSVRSALRGVGCCLFPASHVSRCLSSGQEAVNRAASPGVPQAWWLRLAQVRSGMEPQLCPFPSVGLLQQQERGDHPPGGSSQLCASAAGTAALGTAGAESSPFRGRAGPRRHQLSLTSQPPVVYQRRLPPPHPRPPCTCTAHACGTCARAEGRPFRVLRACACLSEAVGWEGSFSGVL